MSRDFLYILLTMGVLITSIHGLPISQTLDSDSCGPDYSAIHDFQPGDVFERSWTKWSTEQAPPRRRIYSKIVRKYTVLSAYKAGTAMGYEISGIEVRNSGSGLDPAPAAARYFQERLEYIDSAAHFLNQCKDVVVPADTIGWHESGLETKIQIAKGRMELFHLADTGTSIKWIGGAELGRYLDDGSLAPIADNRFLAVFAEGLGLVDYIRGHPYPDESRLTGYVKNGLAVGVITPDEVLMGGNSIRIIHSDKRRENRPAPYFNSGTHYRFDILGREHAIWRGEEILRFGSKSP